MRWARALVFLILTVFLSSCSPSGTDLTGYIKPPQTSKDMLVLQQAIKKIIGESFIKLFPRSGNYRNSIILKDIDKDSIEEAFVFYSSNENQKQAHILILKKVSNAWVSLTDLAGGGSDIDIVDFYDYNEDGKQELICGWGLLNSESKGLSIYSLSEGKPKELLSSSYTSIFIFENSKNNYNGIILMNMDKSLPMPTLRLVAEQEKLPKIISQCELSAKAKSFLSVSYGQLNKQNAFYIDEALDENFLQTEIISFDGTSLFNTSMANGTPLFEEYLKRGNAIFCQDVDLDGIVEIPKTASFVDKQAVVGASSVQGVEWVNFNGAGFIHDFYSVLNLNERYILTFPEKWMNSVVAKKDLTNEGVSFYIKNNENEKNELLFSVLAYSEDEWKNKKNVYGYSLLKSFSDRVYAVKTESELSTRAKEFVPSIEELKALFSQISVKQR